MIELESDITFKQPVLVRPTIEAPQCFKPAFTVGFSVSTLTRCWRQLIRSRIDSFSRRERPLAFGEPAQELL